VPHVEFVVDVITSQGVPFRVVYSDRKDDNGNSIHHTHVVSFYDRRYDFTAHGQFVTDNLVDTIISRGQTGEGINLCGGEPDWMFDATALKVVYRWLMQLLYTLSKF
jgi:hypothetical protein